MGGGAGDGGMGEGGMAGLKCCDGCGDGGKDLEVGRSWGGQQYMLPGDLGYGLGDGLVGGYCGWEESWGGSGWWPCLSGRVHSRWASGGWGGIKKGDNSSSKGVKHVHRWCTVRFGEKIGACVVEARDKEHAGDLLWEQAGVVVADKEGIWVVDNVDVHPA